MSLLAVYVRTDSDLPWWQIAPLTLLAFGIVYGLYRLFTLKKDLRYRKRLKAVEAAAGEHPVFAPAAVKSAAHTLYHLVQEAWDAEDRERLTALTDPQLAADWVAKLDANAAAGERFRVEVKKGPKVDYVGLHGIPDGHPGEWAKVRLRGRQRCWLEKPDGTRRPLVEAEQIDEFWTLSRRDGEWIAFNTRTQEHAEEFLTEDIVAPVA